MPTIFLAPPIREVSLPAAIVICRKESAEPLIHLLIDYFLMSAMQKLP